MIQARILSKINNNFSVV
jgi:hypothetical protein